MDVTHEPRKRSEFNHLQLELEKLKKPYIEDKESESETNKNIETEQLPALIPCVKAGTHRLVHNLHEFDQMIR